MKIRNSRDDQQEALRLLDSNATNANSSAKGKKKSGVLGGLAGDSDSSQDGITVDIPLARSIGQQLDPTLFAAERQARVDEIKRRVQGGTYKLPSSEDLAQKLSEEIGFEILTSGEKPGNEGV